MSDPRVCIGLPTFNRADTLERAARSALAQTHAELELVIADNHSTDATEGLCRALAAADPRVRYVRSASNLGPTANFNALFEACEGDFVMMLADDDWLEHDYLERCLAAMTPSHALVCGLAVYHRGERLTGEGVELQLDELSGAARVRSFYAQVRDNGTFYGLMPREVLRRAAPMPNVLGNDWLLMARIAYQGRVQTLRETRVHRALGGTSADIGSILNTFGEHPLQARLPHLVIAAHVARDVRNPIYDNLNGVARIQLAAACAATSIDWPSLAWHATAPTFATLARRPRGRPLWRAYDRLTRALGAGRG